MCTSWAVLLCVIRLWHFKFPSRWKNYYFHIKPGEGEGNPLSTTSEIWFDVQQTLKFSIDTQSEDFTQKQMLPKQSVINFITTASCLHQLFITFKFKREASSGVFLRSPSSPNLKDSFNLLPCGLSTTKKEIVKIFVGRKKLRCSEWINHLQNSDVCCWFFVIAESAKFATQKQGWMEKRPFPLSVQFWGLFLILLIWIA